MNNYQAVMDTNARSKRGKAQLSHLHVEKAENGGHVVTHHFDGENYKQPESHVFGEGQGKEMLAHIGKHMEVKAAEPKEEEESAAGAAY